jgi:hypothetical protein
LATPARPTPPTAHRVERLAIGSGEEEGKRVVAQGRRKPTGSAQGTLSWGCGREEPLGDLLAHTSGYELLVERVLQKI